MTAPTADPASTPSSSVESTPKRRMIEVVPTAGGLPFWIGLFDEVADYDTYVDGKSRADGTRPFLQSRGIDLPTGAVGDRSSLTIIVAAKVLGVEPGAAAVFEDALSGVGAGRAGGFGFVIGVDRAGQADQVRARGADRVVTDLAQLMEQADPA